MNILMLHQFFTLVGSAHATRCFEIGRRLVTLGHQVTVIAGNSEMELNLGKKRIGLLQTGGMAVVALNIDYRAGMNRSHKARALVAYARLALRQGRHLPRPDLIFAASPPLTAAWPALSLSRHYGVPLVLDLEELWPDAVIKRGSLRNKTLITMARRLEMKAYQQAFRIFVPDNGAAEAVKEIAGSRKKVLLLPGQTDLEGQVHRYEAVFREAADA